MSVSLSFCTLGLPSANGQHYKLTINPPASVEVDCLMLSPVNLLALLRDLVQLRGVDVTSQNFASKIVDVVILDER